MANPEIIDADEAIRLLRGVAGRVDKDYTYTRPEAVCGLCKYAHDGKPSCMIGQALFDAGWTVEELAMLDTGTEEAAIFDIARVYPDLFTPEAGRVFAAAQNLQDEGDTWHQAQADAEEEYRAISTPSG